MALYCRPAKLSALTCPNRSMERAVFTEIMLSFLAMFTGLLTKGKGMKYIWGLWSIKRYSSALPRLKAATVAPDARSYGCC